MSIETRDGETIGMPSISPQATAPHRKRRRSRRQQWDFETQHGRVVGLARLIFQVTTGPEEFELVDVNVALEILIEEIEELHAAAYYEIEAATRRPA
jgi:hypothetical protein